MFNCPSLWCFDKDVEMLRLFDKQAGEIDVSLDNPAYGYLSDVDFVESSFFFSLKNDVESINL